MADNSKDKSKSDDQIVAEARAFFTLVEEAESEIRALALDDLKFRAGDHWPEEIKRSRDLDNRPCLTINKVPQSVQQVTNDQRQNRPSIKVSPVDDKADPETAKIYQGLIRHIEYNSNADVAYDSAFEGAVTGGFGYLRVLTNYVSPFSFDQEILIKRIRNPFSVFFDPFSQEPDGSDANQAIIVEQLSKDEYRARYGKSKLAEAYGSASAWEALGNQSSDWVSADGCRVAEYFYKEFEEKEICLLNTGDVVFKEELEQVIQIKAQQGLSVEVVSERKTKIPTIRWCKLNGIEIIEKTDWPGIYIPIVPVYGQELDINGKRVLEGIVRNAKDPSRMYDYWVSAETEAIALAPRAPFIAAEGQLEGYENEWESANRRNHSVLRYKPVALNGTPVPPPQRNTFEPAVQAITQARMLASDDIKATFGIYDASLGNKSNETSGVAIQRRNTQAQTSNFHFVDNLTRSIRHTGRILLDLIPKIYDTKRAARIIGEEGDQKIVMLNDPNFQENGKPAFYNLSVGKYDTTVDVGPSFASKRQEAVASMLDVTRAVPQVMQVAGDLLVKNMDWPGAQEISERLKKALPPGLAEDPNQKQQPIPPQIQTQMQQMGQMIEQLTANLNELQSEKEQKLIELESRERIEMKKLEVQLEIKRAEIDAKDSLALLNHEIAQINQRLSLLRVSEPINSEHNEQDLDIPQSFDGAQSVEPDFEESLPTGGRSPGQPVEPEGTMP